MTTRGCQNKYVKRFRLLNSRRRGSEGTTKHTKKTALQTNQPDLRALKIIPLTELIRKGIFEWWPPCLLTWPLQYKVHPKATDWLALLPDLPEACVRKPFILSSERRGLLFKYTFWRRYEFWITWGISSFKSDLNSFSLTGWRTINPLKLKTLEIKWPRRFQVSNEL